MMMTSGLRHQQPPDSQDGRMAISVCYTLLQMKSTTREGHKCHLSGSNRKMPRDAIYYRI